MNNFSIIANSYFISLAMERNCKSGFRGGFEPGTFRCDVKCSTTRAGPVAASPSPTKVSTKASRCIFKTCDEHFKDFVKNLSNEQSLSRRHLDSRRFFRKLNKWTKLWFRFQVVPVSQFDKKSEDPLASHPTVAPMTFDRMPQFRIAYCSE